MNTEKKHLLKWKKSPKIIKDSCLGHQQRERSKIDLNLLNIKDNS